MSGWDQRTRDSITIAGLQVVGQNPDGSQERDYTPAGRGSKPTTMSCRAQELTTEQQVEYGLKGTNTHFGFWFNTNPQLSVSDQITYTDQDLVLWKLRVVKPSRNIDGKSVVYESFGESLTPRN
jgi:hypothetical protein